MPAGRSAVPGRWRRQLLDAERRVLDGRSPNQSTSNAPKKSAFARRGEIVLLEFALQGFAGHVAWKSLHDHDLTHSLELGANALVDPSREFHAVGLDALAQGDGRDRRLAPMRMLCAEYSDLGDGRVLDGNLLDIPRINVHAAGDDHVLLAVDQIEEAFRIDVAHIA